MIEEEECRNTPLVDTKSRHIVENKRWKSERIENWLLREGELTKWKLALK